MASMTLPLPFDTAERSLASASGRIRLSQRRGVIRQVIDRFLLTPGLRAIVRVQDQLIKNLSAGYAQNLSPEQMTRTAEKLEAIVKSCDRLIATTQQIDFILWHGNVRRIVAQRERLDSFAETLRFNASEAFTSYLNGLIEQAPPAATPQGNWRELIAALHD